MLYLPLVNDVFLIEDIEKILRSKFCLELINSRIE